MRSIIPFVFLMAWVCTLFMGCYSSTVIEPTAENRERIRESSEIYYVLTKDSIKYVFDTPPVVANDTITGLIAGEIAEEVSIPLSSLAQVGESRSGDIEYVVTKSGVKYMFGRPPTVVDSTLIGKTRPIPSGPVEVRIPLSDVRQARISELDVATTAVLAGSVVVLVAVSAAVLANNPPIGTWK